MEQSQLSSTLKRTTRVFLAARADAMALQDRLSPGGLFCLLGDWGLASRMMIIMFSRICPTSEGGGFAAFSICQIMIMLRMAKNGPQRSLSEHT